jgi:hypothetical protein
VRRQRLIGIGLMCGAVADFACLDAMAKYLGTHMDTLLVVAMRYASAFLLTLLISNPIIRPGLLRTQKPWLQLGRSLLLLGSTVSNFMAFRYLQLDEALAILFSTPFLVAILAGPFLGEWVGWRRWIAIGVGFVGLLVVVRPGFGACIGQRCSRSAARSATPSTASRRGCWRAMIRAKPRCSIPTCWAPRSCCPSCHLSGRRRGPCSTAFSW